MPGGVTMGRTGCHCRCLTLRYVLAVPPSLRVVAKPDRKKRRRVLNAGAKRRRGVTVSVAWTPPVSPPVSPLCPLCHWGAPTLIVSFSSPVPRLRQPAAELQVRPSPCQASCCATLLTPQTARGAPVLPRSPPKSQGVSLRHRRPQ